MVPIQSFLLLHDLFRAPTISKAAVNTFVPISSLSMSCHVFQGNKETPISQKAIQNSEIHSVVSHDLFRAN